ncbi:MAG: EAL domain-containing protein [Pseudomonadales bacterium]|nr:EAL domain-containing protein [Pseudomonadales bacterium]
MRILLIRDDNTGQASLSTMLACSEHVTALIECNTVKAAIELIAENQVDLLFLAIEQPLDKLTLLRSHNIVGPPIIILSEQQDDGYALRCIEAGAQDFIETDELKPSRIIRCILHVKERLKVQNQLLEHQAQLRELALVDSLTTLANRYMFDLSLANAISIAKRQQNQLALIFLDLDKFKEINDTYGHSTGDQVLQEVAARLKETVREADLLCRLGGDEFVILISEISCLDNIRHLTERIVSAFSPAFNINGKQLNLSTSVGVATFPDCAIDSVQLMKCADEAMYKAKQRGRNQVIWYSRKTQSAISQREGLEKELSQAIESNQFELYYQPQISYLDSRIIGIEALIRWNHPKKGLLSPLDFIPIAEQNGVINAIGDWVIDQACLQFMDWVERYDQLGLPLSLSLNLSTAQLSQPALLRSIKSALIKHRVPPDRLELELVEQSIHSSAKARELLNELDKLGVKLALDNFGRGYSSLAHLESFPISILKIDKTFIDTIFDPTSNSNLLKAINQFAKTLGYEVVAECVETPAQLACCKVLKIDRIQGNIVAQAMPAEAFETRYSTSLARLDKPEAE